jgi:hypothetical protein
MTLDGKIYLGDMKIHVPPDIQVLSTAKALLGDVSDAGPSHAASSDTGDMSDMSDSSDMNNMSDDDSDSSAAPKKVQPHPHPQPQAQAQQPHTYTLRVTGAATVGSLEILHDAGASSSH